MIPLQALKAIDILLRDVTKNKHILFGGIPFVLGGDFRQTPPVVHKGNKIKIIESSIKHFVKIHFKKLSLTQNMRADPNAKEFAEWLLKIGNGKESKHRQFGDDIIKLPDQIITKQKDEFINQLFGNVQNINDLKDICCLSTTNKIVNEMNIEIQDKILPGPVFKKVSIDEIVVQDPTEDPNQYPIEYLNSITPSGMPPHELQINQNSIVMLLRNLNLKAGLCNGTRLMVKKINEHSLVCEIISGNKNHIGSIVLIPKIELTSQGDDLPFVLKRFQFPLRLAFCMTINKVNSF